MEETNKQTWTILELVRWGTEYFIKKDIQSPRLNIELLLCELLKINRIGIYTQFEKPLSKTELAELKKMILRRAKHEPLQYIIGHTYFLDCRINLNNSVMIPRPETELLVKSIIDNYKLDDKLKILDIGTGSGCIAIALAKLFCESEIIAVDVSNDALKLAQENAILNKVSNIRFIQINILDEIPVFDFKFDVIVSNPPYIRHSDYIELDKDVLDYEPKTALTDGQDGLTFYKRFSDVFDKLLSNDGKFFLEIGCDQEIEIKNIFSQTEKYETSVIKDLSDLPRIVLGNIINSHETA